MIYKQTLRYGLYASAVTIVVALTAMFGKFQSLTVVSKQVSLSYALLTVILIATGFLASSFIRQKQLAPLLLNGVVGSLVVGIALSALVVIEANIDLTFIFPDLKTDPIGPILTFGQELVPGIILLILVSALCGLVGGWLHVLPSRPVRVIVLSFTITAVIGLLNSQVKTVITLPDALALAIVFGLAYLVSLRMPAQTILVRLLTGAAVGAVAGLLLGIVAGAGGLETGGILRGTGAMPRVLGAFSTSGIGSLILIFAVVGAFGALVTRAAPSVHGGAVYMIGSLLILGVLNWQDSMTYLAALLIFVVLVLMFWYIPLVNQQSAARFADLKRGQQRSTQQLGMAVGLLVMLAAPAFLGQYITSILDLVGLYVIMGIGLNVVVGYAGLLDLGYVAFFAIGAYTVGILTTPSLLTCGGIAPQALTQADVPTLCTGVMTFWEAWPFAVLVAALAGILLGIPVLRLRGDYLAIVTLGFGEIIRLIALSNLFKPLLGAAQGIPKIPSPVINLTSINPDWQISLGSALNIYYVILVAVLVAAFIAVRLANTRLGRAWRAMRTDEDVAQAMGINLTRTKLLAFAVGAAFAGMGGALFGSWLQGIFPNSFTLAVSINVLSLIIIGGLGSIPGVVVGALVLIGLPEVLRELQDYRLLAFGILLVVTMILRPEGLIPPPVRRLSEKAAEVLAKREA